MISWKSLFLKPGTAQDPPERIMFWHTLILFSTFNCLSLWDKEELPFWLTWEWNEQYLILLHLGPRSSIPKKCSVSELIQEVPGNLCRTFQDLRTSASSNQCFLVYPGKILSVISLMSPILSPILYQFFSVYLKVFNNWNREGLCIFKYWMFLN